MCIDGRDKGKRKCVFKTLTLLMSLGMKDLRVVEEGRYRCRNKSNIYPTLPLCT